MAFKIDTSTAFGAAVRDRLKEQKLAWLTTVSSDGTPNRIRSGSEHNQPICVLRWTNVDE